MRVFCQPGDRFHTVSGGRFDQNLKIAMEKYLTVETLQISLLYVAF